MTLVELLVATTMALIVMGALMSTLVVAQHQTAIVRDVGQATQSGRLAMTRIVDELHSSCIAKEFAPVQKESTASKLILINAYSKEAEIKTGEPKTGEQTREDLITFSKEKGTLTDETFLATGGEWPSFTFGGGVKKVIIGSHISELKEGAESVPVFTYYEYKATPEAGGGSGASSTLEKITPVPAAGFSESEAKTIAGVGINFTAAPADGLETVGRSASFKTLDTLAFTAPNTESTVEDGPCR